MREKSSLLLRFSLVNIQLAEPTPGVQISVTPIATWEGSQGIQHPFINAAGHVVDPLT